MCFLSTPLLLIPPNKLFLKSLLNLLFVQRTGGGPEDILENILENVLHKLSVPTWTTLE